VEECPRHSTAGGPVPANLPKERRRGDGWTEEEHHRDLNVRRRERWLFASRDIRSRPAGGGIEFPIPVLKAIAAETLDIPCKECHAD
jgi:hypothetical protein